MTSSKSRRALWAGLAMAVLAACGTGESSLPSDHLHGTESSGGIEVFDSDEGAVWFLDPKRTIRYCYERSPAFPVAGGDIEREIDKAFDVWKDYLTAKQVPHSWPDLPQPALDRLRMARCDGSEDLKFQFGNPSPGAGAKTVALAKRLSYDPRKGWGKGLIWLGTPTQGPLKPDWAQPKALFAALLHELGHVYGCGHVDGTVMSRLLAFDLVLKEPALPESIDWQRELVLPCRTCPTEYRAATEPILSTGVNASFVSYLPAAFEVLSGRKPVGRVEGELRIKNGGYASALEAEYHLRDESSGLVLPVRGNKIVAATAEGAEVLKRYFITPDNTIFYAPEASHKLVHLGTVETAAGKEIAVTISRNLDGHAVVIRTIEAAQAAAPVLFAARANPASPPVYLLP